MARDTQAEYEAAIISSAVRGGFYPAVTMEGSDIGLLLVCANGHRWGSINPQEGCPTCKRYDSLRRMGRTECAEEGCDRLNECSDRAFAAGVRKCELHWIREIDEVTQPMCLDEFVTVWGVHNPRHRWNGWACPSIDPWSVQYVIDKLSEDDHYRYEWQDDLSLKMWTADDEAELEVHPEYAEILRPDSDGLYPLGAMSWTWSEDTEAEELLADRNLDNLVARYEGYGQDILKALAITVEEAS